uniref:Putative group v salivary lipocalin n=1 Tax=Rhipicephalus pulchellus TaxID=72859 RepID=L7M9A2_RHIPC
MYALQAFLIVVGRSLFSEVNAHSNVSVLGDKVLPIVGVFNTSQRLWLYQVNQSFPLNETQPEQETDISAPGPSNKSVAAIGTCIFFKMYNISKNDYYFWLNESYVKNYAISSPHHGKFVNGTRQHLGAMNVSFIETWSRWSSESEDAEEDDGDEGSAEVPYEIMELIYTDHMCSLFFAQPMSKPHQPPVCRLYLTDSEVKKGPSENCTNSFNSKCAGMPGVLYNETCNY